MHNVFLYFYFCVFTIRYPQTVLMEIFPIEPYMKLLKKSKVDFLEKQAPAIVQELCEEILNNNPALMIEIAFRWNSRCNHCRNTRRISTGFSKRISKERGISRITSQKNAGGNSESSSVKASVATFEKKSKGAPGKKNR